MPLTPEQRAELELLGPDLVRQKLLGVGTGRGAAVSGFKGAEDYLLRGDIEDWLSEKHSEDFRVQRSTLRWAKIAGWAAIISVVVGLATLWFTIFWPSH